MRIGIIKEKKFGLLLVTIIFLICCILPFFFQFEFVDKIVISAMIGITYLVILLCFLISMEWYILDKDFIIVKNVFGIVNKVKYKDVKYTYVKRLPVFTRDKGIPCLLFNDGRKERSFFVGNNIDNHKRYIVRIPYIQEVIDYFIANNIELNNDSVLNKYLLK